MMSGLVQSDFHNVWPSLGRLSRFLAWSRATCMLSDFVQGDFHGCPYKTLDPESLRSALRRLRVGGPALEEAVTKARGGHYQLACGAAFAGAHNGCQCDTGINHPNQVIGLTTSELRSIGCSCPDQWYRNLTCASAGRKIRGQPDRDLFQTDSLAFIDRGIQTNLCASKDIVATACNQKFSSCAANTARKLCIMLLCQAGCKSLLLGTQGSVFSDTDCRDS